MRMHALDLPRNPELINVAAPIPLDGTVNGLTFRTRKTVLRDRLEFAEFPSEATQANPRAGSEVVLPGSPCVAWTYAGHPGRRQHARSCVSPKTMRKSLLRSRARSPLPWRAPSVLRRFALAQEHLKKSRDRSRLLLKVNNSLISQLDLRGLLKAISSNLQEVMSLDFAGLALYDSETGQYHALCS